MVMRSSFSFSFFSPKLVCTRINHKDRHEKIGEGSLGLAAFERIVTHPALAGLPFYLETPNELDGYAKEIALLRGFVK